VDVSPPALVVAAGNADRHGVRDRVTFVEGDLFAPVTAQAFDLVVSNPPYIGHNEFPALDIGVRDFEPRSALDGGPDGLDYYRRIATEVSPHLAPGGMLLVEIGAPQEAAVRELFAVHLESGTTFKDAAVLPRGGAVGAQGDRQE